MDLEALHRVWTELAEKLFKMAREKLIKYQQQMKIELTDIIEGGGVTKVWKKYHKSRLFLLNLCLDRLKDKDFSFIEADLFTSFKEPYYQEISVTLYPLLLVLKKFFSLDKLELSYGRILYKKL